MSLVFRLKTQIPGGAFTVFFAALLTAPFLRASLWSRGISPSLPDTRLTFLFADWISTPAPCRLLSINLSQTDIFAAHVLTFSRQKSETPEEKKPSKAPRGKCTGVFSLSNGVSCTIRLPGRGDNTVLGISRN
ncbi:unnamed protein product [Sphacelaria rigidula]